MMAVFEFHGGVDPAEGELASAVLAQAHGGRLDQIEVVAIPQMASTIRHRPISSRPAARSCRRRDQLWRPHQIVGGGSEGEGPVDLGQAAQLGLAQASNRPDPAERLLDPQRMRWLAA
jgi:hypothetical protein